MGNHIRYRKPSLTNLPRELGMEIFKQIENSPKPDDKKLCEESRQLLDKMVALREKEIAEGKKKIS